MPPKVVVHGAQLRCSMGSAPSNLTVTPGRRIQVENQEAATVNDIKPNVNIAPFGMCRSPANPQVAAATSAAGGVLTPQPCIPVIPAPWVPGQPMVLCAHEADLTEDCTCTCQWAGLISIQKAAQTTVFIGKAVVMGGGVSMGGGGAKNSSTKSNTGAASSVAGSPGSENATSTTKQKEDAKLWVELYLHDPWRDPLPGARYEVTCEGQTIAGSADDSGMAGFFVVETAKVCKVRWRHDSQGGEFEYEQTVHLDLPPADDETGLHRRLHNLGISVEGDPDRALTLFQGIWGLDQTGEADTATVDALNKVAHAPIALSEDKGGGEAGDGDSGERT